MKIIFIVIGSDCSDPVNCSVTDKVIVESTILCVFESLGILYSASLFSQLFLSCGLGFKIRCRGGPQISSRGFIIFSSC